MLPVSHREQGSWLFSIWLWVKDRATPNWGCLVSRNMDQNLRSDSWWFNLGLCSIFGHGSKSRRPLNIRFNPTTKTGSEMSGAPKTPKCGGSQNGFDNHSHLGFPPQRLSFPFQTTERYPQRQTHLEPIGGLEPSLVGLSIYPRTRGFKSKSKPPLQTANSGLPE